jgi:O-antigen/teichoic acid export membrane protein
VETGAVDARNAAGREDHRHRGQVGTAMSRTLLSRQLQRLRGGFARNIAVLSGGTLMGQAVGVVTMPIITRLYTPADFAVLGTYTSILAMVLVVAMLKYEVALPICPSPQETRSTLALTLGLALGSSLVSVVVVAAMVGFDPRRATTIHLWAVPLGIFATATYQALSYRALRERDYALVAQTKLTQATGMMGVQLGLGLMKLGPIGLILGHILGQSGGVGTLFRRLHKTHDGLVRGVDIASVRAAARQFRRFPVYSVPAAFMNAAVDSVPLLFVAQRFAPEVAGWYVLVQRIFVIPSTFLSTSVGQVFYGEFGEIVRNRPDTLMRHFLRRLSQIGVATLVTSLPLVAAATVVVPFVFGERWAGAARCLLLLAPAFVLNLCVNATAVLLDVLQRQDLHLAREVTRSALLLVGLLVVSTWKLDWQPTLAVLSTVSALGAAAYLATSFLAVKRFQDANGRLPCAQGGVTPAFPMGINRDDEQVGG